jgi:post-segregation antitoxin (ccd killing protein)
MGVGANLQGRAIALHHLDAPCRIMTGHPGTRAAPVLRPSATKEDMTMPYPADSPCERASAGPCSLRSSMSPRAGLMVRRMTLVTSPGRHVQVGHGMQVYLPDDLYEQVKTRHLSASELLQEAVRAEVRRQDLLVETDAYLADLLNEVGQPSQQKRARAQEPPRRPIGLRNGLCVAL